MALTAATSPSSLPQSSTGRLDDEGARGQVEDQIGSGIDQVGDFFHTEDDGPWLRAL